MTLVFILYLKGGREYGFTLGKAGGLYTWFLLYGSLFLSVWNVSNEMKRK